MKERGGDERAGPRAQAGGVPQSQERAAEHRRRCANSCTGDPELKFGPETLAGGPRALPASELTGVPQRGKRVHHLTLS